jgi:hypothetical protein
MEDQNVQIIIQNIGMEKMSLILNEKEKLMEMGAI